MPGGGAEFRSGLPDAKASVCFRERGVYGSLTGLGAHRPGSGSPYPKTSGWLEVWTFKGGLGTGWPVGQAGQREAVQSGLRRPDRRLGTEASHSCRPAGPAPPVTAIGPSAGDHGPASPGQPQSFHPPRSHLRVGLGTHRGQNGNDDQFESSGSPFP